MVNLLSSKSSLPPFPVFDQDQRARFEERARSVLGVRWPEDSVRLARLCDGLSSELEELENAPSLVTAEALLSEIDLLRRACLDASRSPAESPVGSSGGAWYCYWPGRSLSTGEAEIASRGFFDVHDRPPPGLWVEALGRRGEDTRTEHEVAILCWIPGPALGAAEKGRQACTSGSLLELAAASDALARQIGNLEGGFVADPG